MGIVERFRLYARRDRQLRLPILGADHPSVLLQLLNEKVQNIGAGGIFLVDVIVHDAHVLHREVQALRDEVDRVGRENLAIRHERPPVVPDNRRRDLLPVRRLDPADGETRRDPRHHPLL